MPASTIIRSDDLRHENRRRLLNALRAEGPCSPAHLRKLTGLSAASVSTLCSQMIEQGILQSERSTAEPGKSLRGRPRSQLSLNPAAGHVLTITIIIDCIIVRLVDYAGNVCAIREKCLDTRALSKKQLLSSVCKCVDELCDQHTGLQLHHIGVGFQGQTENATGILLWSPIMHVRNVPLGTTLLRRYAINVSVHNNCRLIAQALSRNHVDLLGDTFATVLFSQGVGLGLYVKGMPFEGTRSSAMEIGHLRYEPGGALCRCGRRGCIEAYAADYGIERLALGLPIDHTPAGRVADSSMDALIAAALAGDKTVSQSFVTAGCAVGEGLCNLFTLVDPMPVALVSRNANTFELMRAGILDILNEHLINGPDPTGLLHCFTSDDSLLRQGLIYNSLSQVDRLFADQHTDNDMHG